MGKVLKPLLVVAAIAIAFVPGVGTAIGGAILATVGTSFAAASLVYTALSIVVTMGLTAGMSMAASALGLGAKRSDVSRSTVDRLNANISLRASRKWAFGHTAFNTDIHYQEWTSDGVHTEDDHGQDFLHQIITVASHKVDGYESIYFDDELAWTAAGGVQGRFVGYLTVDPKTEGNAGNTVSIGDGTTWNATRRMTGLAYIHFVFQVVSRDPDKRPYDSPFSSSVPSRMTIVGRGSPVYDARLDSTVGGSGTQRADNQLTWDYDPSGAQSGRNPACLLLTYLLGWRINGRLALGRGLPPSRIDMASFITAANACDEPVALAAGGSEPRYRADGVFGEDDDPSIVIDGLLSAMGGVLRDTGGALSLTIIHNDLATPQFEFSEDDILGPLLWQQTPDIDRSFNIVRGQFTDPASLYQLIDYAPAELPSIDSIDRPQPLDQPLVQSSGQAQRIAKQMLERLQYQGRLTCDLNHRAWAVQVGDPITLTLPQTLGWDAKPFRVVEHGIRVDGICSVVLQEENAAIYAWDASEIPPVTPAVPTTYDATLDPWQQFLDNLASGATRNVMAGNWTEGTSYRVGDYVRWVDGSVWECILAHVADTTNAPPNATYWKLFLDAPVNLGLTGRLTKALALLPATTGGTILSYAGATGTFQILNGSDDVSDQFELSTVVGGNPQGLTMVYGPDTQYAVTDGFDTGEETAAVQIAAQGVAGGPFEDAAILVATFTLGKIRQPAEVDVEAPNPITGFALSTSLRPDGTARITATWNAPTETDIAYFVASIQEGGTGSFISTNIPGSATEANFDGLIPGEDYAVHIHAVDFGGLTGPDTVDETITAAADSVAPSAPTSFSVTGLIFSFYLHWTNSAVADLDAVEAWSSTTNNSATAVKVATIKARGGTDQDTFVGGYPTGQLRYFWLKSIDRSGNASGFSLVASDTTKQIATTEITPGAVSTPTMLREQHQRRPDPRK
jgi:hypothetical protein